jgi:hypothetical protein
MGLVFHRRLAIPLWAIAVVTAALAAAPGATVFLVPATTLFVIAAVGIAAIVFSMRGAIPWLRTSRSVIRGLPIQNVHCGTDRHRPACHALPAANSSIEAPRRPIVMVNL